MPLTNLKHRYIPEKTIYLTGSTLYVDTTALEQDQQATASIPKQPVKSATEPTNPSLGDEYFNTNDDKKYQYTSTGWKVIDIVGDLEIQDLAGNTLILD